MSFLTPISACLLLLIALGLVERFLVGRAWKAVPIRIHVNGTRGKSTVTRLIWSALREAGIPALAKTTGAAPRLLLPDGSERPLRRRGKPNIREQLRTLVLARRVGARAVVLECMALAPDLQWVAEQSMTRATIGVITNARTDHTEVMGGTVAEIAACLANTIPQRSVLVVGDHQLAASYQRCAEARGSRIVVADLSLHPSSFILHPSSFILHPSSFKENQAIALAVTRELGIADTIALAGMRRAPADPGEAVQGTVRCGAYLLPYRDVRKVNDPESFLLAMADFLGGIDPGGTRPGRPLIVYNHRSDRPQRLLNFAAKAFPSLHASQILVTGERPALTAWRALQRLHVQPSAFSQVAPIRFVPEPRLPSALAEFAGNCQAVVFCGNIHGFDLSGMLRS